MKKSLLLAFAAVVYAFVVLGLVMYPRNKIESNQTVSSHDCATPTPSPSIGEMTVAHVYPVSPMPTTSPTSVIHIATDNDIDLLARTIWAEAECVDSTAERAAVAWCVLNRVDRNAAPDELQAAIAETILAPAQFACKLTGTPPSWAKTLARDVVNRWEREHAGFDDVGRTLPADYLYFTGDGAHNNFTINWPNDTNYWDWSLPDPYTEQEIIS